MTLICAFATGCATSQGDSPSGGFQIPRDCEGLAQRVPAPAWKKGDNAKVLLGRTTVALDKANDTIDATRNCQAAQRERFAK